MKIAVNGVMDEQEKINAILNDVYQKGYSAGLAAKIQDLEEGDEVTIKEFDNLPYTIIKFFDKDSSNDCALLVDCNGRITFEYIANLQYAPGGRYVRDNKRILKMAGLMEG